MHQWTGSSLVQVMAWCIFSLLGLQSSGLLGTNFSEIGVGILSFSFKKMHLKMSSAKAAAILSRQDELNSVTFIHHMTFITSPLRPKNKHDCPYYTAILYINVLQADPMTRQNSWNSISVMNSSAFPIHWNADLSANGIIFYHIWRSRSCIHFICWHVFYRLLQ